MITKVTDNIYRGPRIDDFTPLVDLKISTILNLEDDECAIVNEKSIVSKLNIQCISLPMSEIYRPSQKQLLDAVNAIISNQPIYVHCLHGCDRTGMVIAAYRIIVEHWSVEDAGEEAVNMGHKWYFPPYWLLRKCLQDLQRI